MKMKSYQRIMGTWGLGLFMATVAATPLPLLAGDADPGPAGNLSVATQPGGFKYFVGIVGNPSVPDISWSDEELEQIKALGVNMVQLSIAWGNKPANEVLNLEDMDRALNAVLALVSSQFLLAGEPLLLPAGIFTDHSRTPRRRRAA